MHSEFVQAYKNKLNLSDSMPQAQLIELPENTVSRNLEHLRRLQGNETWNRRQYGHSMLNSDVHDLFYFFGSFPQYMRSFAKMPKPRHYHDRRLDELGGILNDLNLMTEGDSQNYEKLQQRVNRMPPPPPGTAGLTAYRIETTMATYEAFQKGPEISKLRAEELQRYLRRKRRFNAGFVALPLAVGATAYAQTRDPIAAALFAVLAGNFLLMNYRVYPSPTYHALKAKAERADRFIERYLHELR